MKEILKKLASAKSEIGAISKTENNPFFKSKYFDINALLKQVEPILEKHGLLLIQPIAAGLVFSRIFDVESGKYIESSIDLPELSDPQKLGSAITYYRRYTLQSLLALEAEDDDGNKASGHKVNKPVLKKGSVEWDKAIDYICDGGDINAIKKKYVISPSDEKFLTNAK